LLWPVYAMFSALEKSILVHKLLQVLWTHCQMRSKHHAKQSGFRFQQLFESLSKAVGETCVRIQRHDPEARKYFGKVNYVTHLDGNRTHQRLPTWIFNWAMRLLTSLPEACLPFIVNVELLEFWINSRLMIVLGFPGGPLSSISIWPLSLVCLTNEFRSWRLSNYKHC
jgi:hypothetical protein